MKVTINHPLIVFRVDTSDFVRCQTLSAGTYQVETLMRHGERWWKIPGQEVGNTEECWNAVRAPSDTLRKRVEVVSKRIALLVSAFVFALSMLKTDHALVPQQPGIGIPATRFSALRTQYVRGSTYSIAEQPGGEWLVARYATGWQIIYEALSGRGSPLQLRHVVQVHKDLLLVLMLASAIMPSARLAGSALKFLIRRYFCLPLDPSVRRCLWTSHSFFTIWRSLQPLWRCGGIPQSGKSAGKRVGTPVL
jgi:hypothetical protein